MDLHHRGECSYRPVKTRSTVKNSFIRAASGGNMRRRGIIIHNTLSCLNSGIVSSNRCQGIQNWMLSGLVSDVFSPSASVLEFFSWSRKWSIFWHHNTAKVAILHYIASVTSFCLFCFNHTAFTLSRVRQCPILLPRLDGGSSPSSTLTNETKAKWMKYHKFVTFLWLCRS
jgi:hypothetical protein